MNLTRLKLGELLQIVEHKNSHGLYKITDVRGVNNSKMMIQTRADISNRDLTTFKIVNPGEFFFNRATSRNSSKFSITYNYDDTPHIVTSNYAVFSVRNENVLLPTWLYLYVSRPEYDRYAIQNSWGSATEFFNWDDFCETPIDLPPIDVQRKYVAIYEAMLANQRVYEQGINDLKLACDAQIDALRNSLPAEAIEEHIVRTDIRNTENKVKNVMGVSVKKEFRPPTAKVDREKLTSYKIVKPRWLTFVQTTNNEKVFTYAFNDTSEDIVVTSVNEVFYCEESALLPEYLAMFFNRPEFDRYARFHSWGSARETFTWSDLEQVKIPIPGIEIQKSLAQIYESYKSRLKINAQLKTQLKKICPILIRGSIEEASH